jgi:cell division protein FtsN
MGKLANEVTWRLSGDFQPVCYRVQAGKYPDKASAIVLRDEVKAKGFPAIVIESKNKYIVQCGLFESKVNAQNLKKKLRAAGFSMTKVREVPEVEA